MPYDNRDPKRDPNPDNHPNVHMIKRLKGREALWLRFAAGGSYGAHSLKFRALGLGSFRALND